MVLIQEPRIIHDHQIPRLTLDKKNRIYKFLHKDNVYFKPLYNNIIRS